MNVTQLDNKGPLPRGRGPGVTDAEWEARVKLAAVYRTLARFRMTDLIFTHLSARVPDAPNHFLINRYGDMFEEVTASGLIKMDMDGNVLGSDADYTEAGFTIHSAVYMARPDAMAALHTHSRYGVAVSCQKQGLLPLSQMSLMVMQSLAYHSYEGVAIDLDERESLGRDCAHADAIILRNHGLLTIGYSIEAAFKRMYYLDLACQIQCEALSMGTPLTPIPDAVVRDTAKLWDKRFGGGGQGTLELETMMRHLDSEAADYRE